MEQGADLKLLTLLAGDVSALKRGNNDAGDMLVMNHYGSDLFGLTFVEQKPYLGWPETLFKSFTHTRWHHVAVDPDLPDRLFLVMSAGSTNAPVSLVLRQRPARVRLLFGQPSIGVAPMCARGTFSPTDGRIVHLPVRTKAGKT